MADEVSDAGPLENQASDEGGAGRAEDALPKTPTPGALADRFVAFPFGGGVLLGLFGAGFTSPNSLKIDDTIPLLNVFLTPQRAAELSRVLARAAAAVTTLSADETKPQ